ncbi:MAG: radical SAM protein, partial [Candidatus Adiutrix sp.]|nr:radical SAM protein [Candidatus Adiutrix sp.]
MSLVDQYRIDGHKLHLHPRRVADWLEGREIAPIYMEISPSGACNHRCSFCGLDFMGYKPRFLSADILCERLREMGEAGLKSVMFAGEGEPFLHREMGAIAIAA